MLSCDTIIEGVHFLKDDPPESIGHKALAVNLSDLAAKGARPYVYLLALALAGEAEPLRGSRRSPRGSARSSAAAGISLVGGDTTRTPGPLSITITALGLVPHGHAVLRHGAKRGDRLYVTGTIGDAHLGLRLLKDPKLAGAWGLAKEDVAFLVGRYREPLPRNALALALAQFRGRRDRRVGRARRRYRQARHSLSCRGGHRGGERAALADRREGRRRAIPRCSKRC